MIISRNVNSADAERGICGYTEGIHTCKNCLTTTNVVWRVLEREILACSMECARDVYDRRSED